MAGVAAWVSPGMRTWVWMYQVHGVAVVEVVGQLGVAAVQPLRAALDAASPCHVILDVGGVTTDDASAAVVGGMCRYAGTRGSDIVLVLLAPVTEALEQADVLHLYDTAIDVADGLILIAHQQDGADHGAWRQA